MQIKLFNIPIPDSDDGNEKLNRFLRSKQVLQTENHLVDTPQGTYWCFCIKYLDDKSASKRKKIDYREVLDKESFDRFAAMRKIRKTVAEDEGVPAYAIFTDEELANLPRIPILTPAAMQHVNGVGTKKIEKYGHFFLDGNENEKSR